VDGIAPPLPVSLTGDSLDASEDSQYRSPWQVPCRPVDNLGLLALSSGNPESTFSSHLPGCLASQGCAVTGFAALGKADCNKAD
jgi:hypothetical protein